MQTRLFDLAPERRAALVESLAEGVCADAEVIFAYLYGSFARGEPFHDVDVGVYLTESGHRAGAKALDLAGALSQRIGYPVDVRVLNNAPVPFRFKAVQGVLLIDRDEERLASFLERTGMAYADLAPRLRQATRDAFAR